MGFSLAFDLTEINGVYDILPLIFDPLLSNNTEFMNRIAESGVSKVLLFFCYVGQLQCNVPMDCMAFVYAYVQELVLTHFESSLTDLGTMYIIRV